MVIALGSSGSVVADQVEVRMVWSGLLESRISCLPCC